MKLTNTFLTVGFCFIALSLSAQLSLGISRGIAFYQGDVSEPSLLRSKDYNTATGGFIKYQLTDKWSLRTSYMKSTLSGRDKNYTKIEWRQKRGFQFISPITEILQSVEWDVLKIKFNKRKNYKKPSLSFYLMNPMLFMNK
jgi:Domain of unknown function (DUF6089)